MAETIISPGVFTRENDLSFIQPEPLDISAALIGPTVKGPVEIPTVVTSYGEYQRKFGSKFESGSAEVEFLTSIAARNYFQQGGNSLLVSRVVNGSFTRAASTHISASANGGTAPFQLETLGKGIIYNSADSLTSISSYSDGSLVSGSEDNLRWEISNINNAKGTFSVSIRRGDDNTNNKVVLETFNNVTLDPSSDNYIERVIGNQVQTLSSDGSDYYVSTTGSYANNSNYVRVASVSRATLNYLANDGLTVREDSSGTSYSGSLPTAQSGAFYNATGDIVAGGANYYNGFSGSDIQGIAPADYNDVISLLGNTDEYRFNVITAPGLNHTDHSTQVNNIISLAETRGDCIAVVDTVDYGSTVSAAANSTDAINSSYAATYWPFVQVSTEVGENQFIPASTVIPGVYAFSDNLSAPWFAPAGLVRGGITGVIQAERKLTKSNRDTLYEANVNPIATFPGSGISVFGQKTLQSRSSALDRVNVRRLLIDLKNFFSDQARNLVFEQNTITTRNNFLAVVNPYLESVVQRQGLYAFRVVMDDTNNTADVIDRNQLIGQVFIQPAKTSEFIVLDFTVEPTGATFVA